MALTKITGEGVGSLDSLTTGSIAVAGASGAQITVTDNSPGTVSLFMGAGNSSVSVGSTTSDPLTFLTNNTEKMRIDANGHVTKPLQPAFLVRPASEQSNIAVSSAVTIVFGTEVFDQNGDFASNTFTAPVTGRYQLSANIRLNNTDSASDYYRIELSTSNRTYWQLFDPDFGQDAAFWTVTISVLVDMDASDTAIVRITQGGGTQQTDIDANNGYTTFSGYLVA